MRTEPLSFLFSRKKSFLTVLGGPTWVADISQDAWWTDVAFSWHPRKKYNVFNKVLLLVNILVTYWPVDTFKNPSRALICFSLRVVCLIHSEIGSDCLHSNFTRCQPLWWPSSRFWFLSRHQNNSFIGAPFFSAPLKERKCSNSG
jgi:hypothetical protein